ILAANVPFGGITTGTNTTALMTVASGAQIIISGGGIFNASGVTTANNFLLPVISGGTPTANGSFMYDPSSSTWKAAVSGGTNTVPTIPGNLVPGNCVQAAANQTLTTSANPCGTGGGGSGGQINYPVSV